MLAAIILGGNMENVIVITVMMLLCLSAKDKKLPILIAVSCGLIQVVYESSPDIAVYYAVTAMLCVMTAAAGLHFIKSTSSKVLAVLLTAQSALCVILIFDWPFIYNEWLQFKLDELNGILVFILIGLGVTGSDNAIKRRCFNT